MSNLDVSEEISPELTGAAEANSRRLRAWMDVSATSVPALVVALGSASLGGLAVLVHKHRRR